MRFEQPPVDPGAACAGLVNDPRHASFARTLMLRPPAKWLSVSDLASAADGPVPGALWPELVVTGLHALTLEALDALCAD